MTKEKKISDEQLINEIKGGKNFKEIADEYSYGYPSKTLSERVQNLGYENNQKFTLQDWGGATISLDSGTLEKARELSGVEYFIEDEKQKLYKYYQVVSNPESFELEAGDIVMRLSDRSWRKKEVEE